MTISLAFHTAPRLPRGFGFLVPRIEGKRMLACTFLQNKFAGRAPSGAALLRCFYGGTTDATVLSLDDEEAAALGLSELRQIIGLTAAPDWVRVQRWPRAMAQYTVGHGSRLQKIMTEAARYPGLFLAGNGYSGIGISDCIVSGGGAARGVLARS
jgi:oxygen-dependent protoporphyrinogen oxidase